MITKTHKVITIETHQQIWIRGRGKSFVAWCEACAMKTLMLTPEQAALIGNATERLIFRRIENGELHFIETDAGALFVCSNSLVNNNPNH